MEYSISIVTGSCRSHRPQNFCHPSKMAWLGVPRVPGVLHVDGGHGLQGPIVVKGPEKAWDQRQLLEPQSFQGVLVLQVPQSRALRQAKSSLDQLDNVAPDLATSSPFLQKGCQHVLIVDHPSSWTATMCPKVLAVGDAVAYKPASGSRDPPGLQLGVFQIGTLVGEDKPRTQDLVGSTTRPCATPLMPAWSK